MPIFKVYNNSATELLNNQYKYRYFILELILSGVFIFYLSYFLRTNIEGIIELPNWKKMCLEQKWSKLLIKASFMGGQSIFIILVCIFNI